MPRNAVLSAQEVTDLQYLTRCCLRKGRNVANMLRQAYAGWGHREGVKATVLAELDLRKDEIKKVA